MSSSSCSDGEEPYAVFWKTESIFGAAPVPLATTSAVVRTPAKRTTTIAKLASPSTSGIPVVGAVRDNGVRSLRQAKKRRPLRNGGTSHSQPAIERMDEATLRTMGVLAARLSGRARGEMASPAPGTTSVRKGKEKERNG